MGFLLLSLLVGTFLFFFLWIGCKLKLGKIFKISICVLSVLALLFFASKMFNGADSFINTIIFIIGIECVLVLPLALSYEGVKKHKLFIFLNTIAIVLVGTVLSFACGSGYENEVSEIETVKLVECNFNYEGVEKTIYVYGDEYNYIYLKVNSNTNKFEEAKIPKSQAKVEESDDCTEPRLVVCERKAKDTFWSLGLKKEKEYVFYVPTGTLCEDIFA